VANYKNVTIPTNLDVKDAVKDRFGEFYAALFDRTIEKNPGAVVTEYAWQATNCDPCPGPVIAMGELSTLGLDVLGGEKGVAKPFAGNAMGFVLTRLHARYGKTVTEDLVFKAADPIVGGREFLHDNGKLEERSRPDSINNFQARYAIRHEWTGPIQCAKPIRGRWGWAAERRDRGRREAGPGPGLRQAGRGQAARAGASGHPGARGDDGERPGDDSPDPTAGWIVTTPSPEPGRCASGPTFRQEERVWV
jgi:hypothetical protein